MEMLLRTRGDERETERGQSVTFSTGLTCESLSVCLHTRAGGQVERWRLSAPERQEPKDLPASAKHLGHRMLPRPPRATGGQE